MKPLTAAAALCAAVLMATPLFAQADPPDGRILFINNCSACHGIDGTGAPQTLVGFEQPVPDFSDCSFATREANTDWYYVASEGGPARGFSEIMPEWGSALSHDEIISILDHIRTFCPERSWPRGELNLPLALKTGKAFPEDEIAFVAMVDPKEPRTMEFVLKYEQRIGARNQVEVIIPFGSTEQPASGSGLSWQSAIGDLGIAYKRVLLASLSKGTIISVGGELFFNTGDPNIDLGTGTSFFEPYIVWGQLLPAGFHLQCHAGAGLPFNKDRAAQEAFWRITPGYTFRTGRYGRAWSPMVELTGAKELESGSVTDWTVTPEMQVTLSDRQHVRICGGVSVPLNDTDVRRTTYMFYVIWDWYDGKLWEGW